MKVKSDYNIRPYVPQDLAEVLALFAANTPRYFGVEEKEDLQRFLQEEIEWYFVVEQLSTQTIVASGGMNHFKGTEKLCLSWGMVHPEFHGKGIGTLLLNFRIEFLESLGEKGRVMVRTSQLVFPFYEKNGFTIQERVSDYWSKGLDLVAMDRVL